LPGLHGIDTRATVQEALIGREYVGTRCVCLGYAYPSSVFRPKFGRYLMKKFLIALVLALTGGVVLAQDETIELGYVLWDSEIASTHVVAAVLMDELGYDVNLTSVDAGPMWTGGAQGDFDAIVAARLPATHEAYWAEYGDQLVALGPNLEGADIGWAVPAYVDVDSITELNDNADLFGGEVIGIDPGAGL